MEVFLNDCQNPSELYVSQATHDVVSSGVVLIANENWELNIEPLHDLGLLSASEWLVALAQSDLPMSEQPLDLQVQADEEADQLVVGLAQVEVASEVRDLQDLPRQVRQLSLVQQVLQEVLLVYQLQKE